jgi:hypothetical protein
MNRYYTQSGHSPRLRVLVHRVRVPGRLRIRPQLRTTAGCRAVGKCCEALFLRQCRGACEHSWVYRTTYRRWIGGRNRETPGGKGKVAAQLYPPMSESVQKKKKGGGRGGGASGRLGRYFMYVELYICRAAHRGNHGATGFGLMFADNVCQSDSGATKKYH